MELGAAPTLLRAAREAYPDGDYRLGDAASLPLSDASFDVVVAANSLMDVPDAPASIAAVTRVLEHDGRLCISVAHLLFEAGQFEAVEPTPGS